MASWKVTITTILMIVLSGVIKAHLHFVRLALLALLGLLGLYLLHNLAQDYNRIIGSSSGGNGGGGGGGGGLGVGNLFRPSQLTSAFGTAAGLLGSSASRVSKRSVDSQISKTSLEDLISKLTGILYFDPIGCARKFVCYSAGKPAGNLTRSEHKLLELFQSKQKSNGAFNQFQEAVKLGRSSKNTTLCEKKYKACYLSNKQLSTFYKYF